MTARCRVTAFALLVVCLSGAPCGAQARWPETAAVLQAALRGELTAHAKYVAYARKAREENYPRLAYFALALSVSEGVHARNFERVLKDLGATPDLAVPAITVDTTQANIRNASAAELEEIDTRYPAYLKRITPEGYRQAIDVLTYAWQAEKQHRDLVQKIIAGSGILFGILSRTIEGTPVDYYVCRNCGSTLMGVDLTKDRTVCPICGGPISQYTKVDPGE
jgi:rubrerythrin